MESVNGQGAKRGEPIAKNGLLGHNVFFQKWRRKFDNNPSLIVAVLALVLYWLDLPHCTSLGFCLIGMTFVIRFFEECCMLWKCFAEDDGGKTR